MLRLQLHGPFALTDELGVDRRPKLMKARAILAVLAATKGHRHTRSWLISLLWSDRQHSQALSSLRSALTDIRRRLGPYADALKTDHSEVALDPTRFEIEDRPTQNGSSPEFLEGFDVGNAAGFEDWLLMQRMAEPAQTEVAPIATMPTASARPVSKGRAQRLYLAAHANSAETFTKMQCDSLVDCVAKSTEELGLAETIDGRGHGTCLDDFRKRAMLEDCDLILVSESAESPGGAIARLKVVDRETASLIWSKSLTGRPHIDLEDPNTIAAVAGFVDILSERELRTYRQTENTEPSPQVLALSGINQLFRLGLQNFEAADVLLKRAHVQDRRGRYLAWRAFLRTFMLCEMEVENREAVIDEGTTLARHALEAEPHNSMVLALCAHVENMLHSSYETAFDLSSRALDLNKCNPLAWASLGAAASFLGETDKGYKISKVGVQVARNSKFAFQAESWASATGLLAGDFDGARRHAESSHNKAPKFAPPMRYLSALYCVDGQFSRAAATAEKLRIQEPTYTLDSLGQDGYPADSLRQSGVLKQIPCQEF